MANSGEDEAGARGGIEFTEQLVVDRIVHLRVGSQTLRARLPGATPPGDPADLRAGGQSIHLFAADDDRRLTAG